MYRLETSKTTRRLVAHYTILASLDLPPSSSNRTRLSEQLSILKVPRDSMSIAFAYF